MNQFESRIVSIPYSQQRVYQTLSDLSNLEKVRSMLPEDKVKDLKVDSDAVSLNVSPVGDVAFHIVEREEPKCVKFQASSTPIPLTLWVQMLPVDEDACKVKLTLRTELNPFIKGMVQKPIQEGIDRLADLLGDISYISY